MILFAELCVASYLPTFDVRAKVSGHLLPPPSYEFSGTHKIRRALQTPVYGTCAAQRDRVMIGMPRLEQPQNPILAYRTSVLHLSSSPTFLQSL